MMPFDRVIDPVTKDYVRGTNGTWTKTDTAATAVYHAVASERAPEGGVGGWWRDRVAGSRLHTLRREGVTSDQPRRIERLVEDALARLVQRGRISPPTVAAVRDPTRRDGIAYVAEATDTKTSSAIAVKLPSIGA